MGGRSNRGDLRTTSSPHVNARPVTSSVDRPLVRRAAVGRDGRVRRPAAGTKVSVERSRPPVDPNDSESG
jgi:hypothetical protein